MRKNTPIPIYTATPPTPFVGGRRGGVKNHLKTQCPHTPGGMQGRGGENKPDRRHHPGEPRANHEHTRAHARANPKKFYLCGVKPKPKEDEQQRQQTAHDARCNVKMPGLCRPGNRAHDARMCMPGSPGQREQAHRRRDTRTEFIIQTIGSRPGAADV